MKISEILRLAADKHLWDGIATGGPGTNWDDLKTVSAFICHAICEADGDPTYDQECTHPAVRFLASMGMPLSGSGFVHWDQAGKRLGGTTGNARLSSYEQQQVRYAWMQLAADIAEEEGL